MRLVCQKADLLAGISTVQKALPSKTTMQVLEGIYLETQDNTLRLVATDLNIGIESYIPVSVTEVGTAVLPGRMMAEIIRRMPDGPIEISQAGKKTYNFWANGSRITLTGLNAEDYPKLPSVDSGVKLTLPQTVLKKLIEQTIFAVAMDESRPILTGSLLEIESKQIRMVALDGCRLAVRSFLQEDEQTPAKAVVPGRALAEIARILPGGEEPVSITLQDNHILFDLVHTRMVARLLEGEFVKYRPLITTEFSSEITVSRRLLEESIERASLMAREGKHNYIVFNLRDQLLVITSRSETGDVYEEIPASLEGKNLEIGFNAKYFTDCLKTLDDEYIRLRFNSALSPCLVQPADGEAFTYLILPMRM